MCEVIVSTFNKELKRKGCLAANGMISENVPFMPGDGGPTNEHF